MDVKRILAATVVGALSLTAAGYAVFSVMFPRFYTNFMQAGSASAVARQPFLIWPIALAMVSYALLMTLAIARTADTLTVPAGMKVGAVAGGVIAMTLGRMRKHRSDQRYAA